MKRIAALAAVVLIGQAAFNIEIIGLMKQSMELGHSATKQLEAFAADTSRPVPFRDAAAMFLKRLRRNDEEAPIQGF